MRPLISFLLNLVGGFAITFLLCILVMIAIYGIDPDVGKKVAGMNRADYQRWVSETAIPRMMWISFAGAFLCGALGLLRHLLKKK
jgi:hypothetical protein